VSVLSVRIGSRTSRLAQAQTSIISGLIKERSGDDVEIEVIPVRTLGDRLPPAAKKSLGRAGEKGAFTADLEAMLLEGKIDVAVHSMKDMTSVETEGLIIGATPPRSDPRDALVSGGKTIDALPRRAKVGTSSLRRKAQLLRMRPDLEVVELHGNVDTRLRKVGSEAGGLDAIVLAAAGLKRIGEAGRISQTFSVEEMIPAVCQGIIAVQIRRNDRDVKKVLSQIDDEAAASESSCERAFAKRLGADCNVPVGGCASVSGRTIKMTGMVAREDGSDYVRVSASGERGEAVSLGRRLADELLEGQERLRSVAS